MRTLRWLAVGSLVAGCVVGGSFAAAAPIHPSKKPTVITFSTPTLSMTTSTHKKLRVDIEGERSDQDGMIVSLKLPSHREQHQWFFQLKPGSFTVNTATGKGSLKTGASQIAPFGRVSLTFKPIGKTTTTGCNQMKTVTHRVHVTGTVRFNTHSAGSHSWGSLGSIHKKLTFVGHGKVAAQYGDLACAPNHVKCSTGVGWQVEHGAVIVSGEWTSSHGKRQVQLFGLREVSLATPAHSGREDTVFVTDQPPPALTISKGLPTLVATTSGHGASGSAELTSPTADPMTSDPCSGGHDEVGAGWSDASFVNGDSAYKIHEQIEGPIHVADQTTGGFISVTRQTD